MNIFKPMRTNTIIAILAFVILCIAVFVPAVISHYPGFVQLKGPMGTELTVDGRFSSYPAKNHNSNYSLTDTDKLPPVH